MYLISAVDPHLLTGTSCTIFQSIGTCSFLRDELIMYVIGSAISVATSFSNPDGRSFYRHSNLLQFLTWDIFSEVYHSDSSVV